MTELEEYYNEWFKKTGDADFGQLPNAHKEAIKQTFHFAFWRLNRAFESTYKEIIKKLQIWT